MVYFGDFFRKLEACGQTVLADRSLLIGQKLVKIKKKLCETFWVIFKQCAFFCLQPSRCRSSGHLFVMERQGRWHHVGLSDQWQPFGGVIKKKTFVFGVIPNHHFFLSTGNSFCQELFSPCHM